VTDPLKLLIHGPHPDMHTGYASQMGVWLPRMKAHGISVAVSCTAGQIRHNSEWNGIPVYGRGPYTDMAEDLVRFHYADFGADLAITLCCPWPLHGAVWKHMRTIHLMPVDRDPLGVLDWALLNDGGGTPAAVSRFGERVLRDRGLEPLYLPHAIDTGLWRPPADRAKLRQANGLDHLFVVGINAANCDPDDRKNFYESVAGFAEFRREHPMSVLLMHSAMLAPDGINLLAMTDALGIRDHVVFSNQYQIGGPGAPAEAMAAWYGMCDVTLMLGNEGYGLPGAESAACGTPVIWGGWGPGPELAGPGWLVAGQRRWHDKHHAWWYRPLVADVAAALGEAYESAGLMREQARQFAVEALDADVAWKQHWVPVLEAL
jgi:glycosyltransferase involved in cell wall biosynthesis